MRRGWVVVLLVLVALVASASARPYTKEHTGQTNILTTVDGIVVRTSLRSEVDGGRPWCQAEPTVYYVLHAMVVGQPNRHINFVVDTRSPYLVFPDEEVGVSQTVRTPTVTTTACGSGVLGAEVLYPGSGMVVHSLAVLGRALPLDAGLAMPDQLPGYGVLGMGMDARAYDAPVSHRIQDSRGMWVRQGADQGVGWANATMFFGNTDNKGWVMFNTTAAHPFAYDSPTAVTATATPLFDAGYELHQPVHLTIGDNTWERQAVFVPELPFIELPEALFDTAIMPLGANVHEPDLASRAWHTMLQRTTVTVQGKTFGLHEDALVVSHPVGDTRELAKFFLFRRGPPGSSAIRFGCAPFHISAFVDAVQHANATAGGMRLSLAVTDPVAIGHGFNKLAFAVVVVLLLQYEIGRKATSTVVEQQIARPTHSLVQELHHGWSLELVELLSGGVSIAVVVVNLLELNLVPRYAYLMDAPLATGETFAAVVVWSVCVLGALNTVVVALELAVVRMASTTVTDRVLSLAVAPFVALQGPVQANTRLMGTLHMWNFHLTVRRICMHVCLLLSLSITCMQGPRNGYSVRLLAAIVFCAFALPATTFVGLCKELWQDAAVSRSKRASWATRLQMVVYTGCALAFMLFVVIFLVEPMSTMVFPVFPTNALWVISSLVAILAVGMGILGQLNGRDATKAGPKDRIDSMLDL